MLLCNTNNNQPIYNTDLMSAIGQVLAVGLEDRDSALVVQDSDSDAHSGVDRSSEAWQEDCSVRRYWLRVMDMGMATGIHHRITDMAHITIDH
ncbi:hypothetical protein AF331_13995 [Rossellomorea marisflavi]|uniref:Uncharacterized protein n=1 Tax=Rossellomorea marisflavi TaxID=189381 RepID=A0A0M0G5M9_9BACI|nr:hypothetical protein AF331_13995 [Rossellomorea marisflavi]